MSNNPATVSEPSRPRSASRLGERRASAHPDSISGMEYAMKEMRLRMHHVRAKDAVFHIVISRTAWAVVGLSMTFALLTALGYEGVQRMFAEQPQPRHVTLARLRALDTYYRIARRGGHDPFSHGRIEFSQLIQDRDLQYLLTVDGWGKMFRVRPEGESERDYIVYSCGPNQRDDCGTGDDIVSEFSENAGMGVNVPEF